MVIYQAFLSDKNNLQIDLFDLLIGPLLQDRVDLGVMTMKGYSILHRSLELEPYHQM